MSIKNSVIVIPTSPRREEVCDFLLQTSQFLANKNNVYLINTNQSYSLKEWVHNFINGSKCKLRKKVGTITYLTPIEIFPFQRFKIVKKINQIIYLKGLQLYLSLKHLGVQQKIFWVFFPHHFSIIKQAGISWKIFYDCVDYYQHFSTSIQKTENQLLILADKVFVNSQTLLSIHSQHDPEKVFLVPQGFRLKSFLKSNLKNNNCNLKLPDKPIIGYVGTINNRLDFNLIYKLAKNNPQWQLVLWGPTLSFTANKDLDNELNKLKNLPNVTLGQSSQSQIPYVIENFDIGLIPYDMEIDFNKYCYPMKLFEYFYMGKPVISTPIKELTINKFKSLIKIGNSVQEWEKHIAEILSKPWPKKLQKKQRQLAIDNSWENKIESISKIISNQT